MSEQLKQLSEQYQAASIILHDAINTYRKKTELVDNLAESEKVLRARIDAHSAEWAEKLDAENGRITGDVDKVALLTAASSAELPVVIQRQQSAGLEKLEALADLVSKGKRFIAARRELCKGAAEEEIQRLTEEAISAVRLVFAFNQVCGGVKGFHKLQGVITDACDCGHESLDAARQHLEKQIKDGNNTLAQLPREAVPSILSKTRKYPSAAQMYRAKRDPDYALQLISGAVAMTGGES
ncbi:hypothetical protein A8535_003712 [Escherichia coli]|uniref:hypothetical protein n=1 Tax=Escherichia coli TaxID=562 RepID=UPI000E20BD16|nr:hypothetical protein [Escherichia coli]EEV9228458.1 hypothetical protein [Escherichia coli]EFK2996302.1 hypothetical protein [Escherichia coli]EFO4250449.1 hypothetical protein [Escherichia coli]EJC2652712.1 hypothetical protein [Escherichia coli]MCN4890587.1 hypothetical protein [Escherichia coli]